MKPNLSTTLAGLADVHATRYIKTAHQKDLDKAISITRVALSISSCDERLGSILLVNVGNLLFRRYLALRRWEDAEEALWYALQARNVLGEDDPRVYIASALISAIRLSRYTHLKDTADLECAVSMGRESVQYAARSNLHHLNPCIPFNNLASVLCTRYEKHGRRDDLEESVSLFDRACASATDPAMHAVCLVNSAYVLALRYRLTGRMSDLSSALDRAHQATAIGEGCHPDTSVLLGWLDDLVDRRRGSESMWLSKRPRWRHQVKGLFLLLVSMTIFMLLQYLYPQQVVYALLFVVGIVVTYKAEEYSFRREKHPKQAPVSVWDVQSMSSWNPFRRSTVTTKLLAVPIIPVPFFSSMPGIQRTRPPRRPTQHDIQPRQQPVEKSHHSHDPVLSTESSTTLMERSLNGEQPNIDHEGMKNTQHKAIPPEILSSSEFKKHIEFESSERRIWDAPKVQDVWVEKVQQLEEDTVEIVKDDNIDVFDISDEEDIRVSHEPATSEILDTGNSDSRMASVVEECLEAEDSHVDLVSLSVQEYLRQLQ